MAGYGPPPAERRRRRNADTYADVQVTVSADTVPAEVPPLPGARRFLKPTRDWYETWCKSPQAAAFIDTDWQRLHMLAPIVDQYFREPSPKLLAEIRLNESLLGATHVDRLRGRIKVEQRSTTSDRGTADNVADLMAERRRRLMSDAS